MAGIGGIVGSLLMMVLGSELWKMEKTKLRRDTVEATPITMWIGEIKERMDRQMI
jgi:hypothetical protein